MTSKPEKILLVGWNADGGANVIVQNLRKGLEERGLETDVAYHHFDSPVTVQGANGQRQFRNADEFIEKEELERYLTIHTHVSTFTDEQLAHMRSRTGASPIIYTAHSIVPHDTLNSVYNAGYKKWLDEQPPEVRRREIESLRDKDISRRQLDVVSASDRVINMTQRGNEIYEAYYPEYAGKSIVIPNGSNIHKLNGDPHVMSKAAGLRKKFGEGTVVLYTGRLHQDKGVLDLADAFNAARQNRGDLKLVYVGASPDKAVPDMIRNRIAPELRGDVYFEGWINEERQLAAEYAAADMVVLPSHYESFGLSALEGMMMGKPTIVSDVDGMGDVFVKPWYAYGIQPGNYRDIADKISYVADNPAQTKANAARVQEAVSRKYSFDRIVDAELALYFATMIEKIMPSGGRADRFRQYLRPLGYRPEAMQEVQKLGVMLRTLGEISNDKEYTAIARNVFKI